MKETYAVHFRSICGGTLFLGMIEADSHKEAQDYVVEMLIQHGIQPQDISREVTTYRTLTFKNGDEIRVLLSVSLEAWIPLVVSLCK